MLSFILGIVTGVGLCSIAGVLHTASRRGKGKRKRRVRQPKLSANRQIESRFSWSAKKKVLIVHDTEDVADYVADVLRPTCGVEVAYNGTDGYRKAKKFQPDMLIANTTMPGMGGIELCQKIRKEKTLSDCKVVICSGLHPPPERKSILHYGADDFLREPFSREDLFAMVEKFLK